MGNLVTNDAYGTQFIKTVGAGTEEDPYIQVSQEGDIPSGYSKQTASGDTFAIQKGQLNNLRLRPQIMNEHAESSRNVQGFVTPTSIVGQIFKASQDNINGINLTMESSAAVSVDTFESYADSAALQATWIASGALATLEEAIVHDGVKAMNLPASLNTGDEWAFASVADYSGYTGRFWMYSNNAYSNVKMRVFLEDSLGNTNSAAMIQVGADEWTEINVLADAMTADGGTPAVLTDIVKIGYRVEANKNGGYVIIDTVTATPAPGSVEVKLWDMGTELPESTVTALTDGTQYEKLGDRGISGLQTSSVNVELRGGKRMYHIDAFIAGVALEIPGNETLNVGHYYAITIHYVDTNVSVYGPNEAWVDYYNNGYGFTTDAEANAITAMGANKDIQFIIFSTQDVYIYEITVIADGTPNGNSLTTVYVEDENMIRTDILVSGIKAVPSITTMLRKPFFMTKGSKLEQEYNDDFTDDVTSINLVFQYLFEPPVVNG